MTKRIFKREALCSKEILLDFVFRIHLGELHLLVGPAVLCPSQLTARTDCAPHRGQCKIANPGRHETDLSPPQSAQKGGPPSGTSRHQNQSLSGVRTF
jgi:hypothetical protein